MSSQPTYRREFDAGQLILEHPPRWSCPNKRIVFDIAASSGYPFAGQVGVARWPSLPVPNHLVHRARFDVKPGVFAYEDEREDGISWHLNFSDPHLFVAYSGSLLAQDELQVAEHSILGSVREALRAAGLEAMTVGPNGEPTPVTVSGAQRRCAIDTAPDPEAGLAAGLYGNAFRRASEEQIATHVRPLSPPTVSNILAMAAPSGGSGAYSRKEVEHILETAYSGFFAARSESARLGATRTTIHTGFWGCGAFGGNRRLMTLVQRLAADLADVDLTFWAFDESGVTEAEEGARWYDHVRGATSSVSELVSDILNEGLAWGVSDGN